MAKYLRNNAGAIVEEAAVAVSAGAGDAGKIPALDGTGRLDETMMPVGIGADTASLPTSENLAAGDYVNIFDDSGTATARKADATTAGKEAHGFVLTAVTSPPNATVYFEGPNTQVSGQTPGPVFLQTTAGVGGSTVPSAAGNIVQKIGFAYGATAVNFEPAQPITLA